MPSSPSSPGSSPKSLRSSQRTGGRPSKAIAILMFFAVPALAFAAGCNRTVLVPESSPIRVGPSARMQVYTLRNGEWILSDNKVTVPEGWYMVPPSFVEEER